MNQVHIFALFVTALVLIDCNNDTFTPGGELDRIAIVPDAATLTTGQTIDFDVVGITVAGDTVSAPGVRWWSTDTAVIEVDDSGAATARNPGEAL